MGVIVTSQRARVERAIVDDERCPIGCDYIKVKTHHTFPGQVLVLRCHAMRGMTGGTRKPVVDVPGMFAESCVGEHLLQVMAFTAERVRAIDGQIRIGEKIVHQSPGDCRNAELISTLENVTEL